MSARALALGVDLALVAGVVCPVMYALGVPASASAMIAGVWALTGLMGAACEYTTGASPGKWLVGLRVIGAAGRRPAMRALMRRNLHRGLIDLLFLVSSANPGLLRHDETTALDVVRVRRTGRRRMASEARTSSVSQSTGRPRAM